MAATNKKYLLVRGNGGNPMSLFYKQNAAARFFVDQMNGKVYEVVGGSAALLCWRIRLGGHWGGWM